MSDFHDDFPGDEAIEAYCVSCKQKVEIVEPVPVWTSKGQAATRGTCPDCGSNVFRMGRTYLHGGQKAPKAVQVIPTGVRTKRAAYLAAAVTDAEFADKLGAALHSMGVHLWIDNGTQAVEDVEWSNGVHPALEQCSHLVLVVSGFTEQTTNIQEAWEYFLRERKPILLVMREAVDPPDALRSRPRYDFTGDYKAAFRGLVAVLSG